MSDDNKTHIVQETKDSPMYVMQLDESTDVSSCAQLMVFVRYIYNSIFMDEFLFCQSLHATTRGIDVFHKINSFIEQEGLD